MAKKNLLTLPNGSKIDATYTRSVNHRANMIIYPCMGGTTRMYNVPFQALDEEGISILEFHPPAHGRSTGQMTMELAFYCFNWILDYYKISKPIFLVGHSAGVNALVQYQHINQSFTSEFNFYIQPVCDFSHSATFMYNNGYRDELISAIEKWVTDPEYLHNLLSNEDWLNEEFWNLNKLRKKIDEISKGIMLGEFLEDFYIRNNNISELYRSKSNSKTYISKYDHWYNYKEIISILENNNIKYGIIDSANDHYFRGGWDATWDDILLSIKDRT